MIKIILAIDPNGGIGLNGNMLFHDPTDLKRFKALTMGHYVLMGRKTYESIPIPLKGRKELVITNNPLVGYHKEPYSYIESFKDIKDLITSKKEVVWCIGGATTLALLMAYYEEYIEEYHFTYFKESSEADTKVEYKMMFPFIQAQIEHSETINDTKHPHTYIVWKRKLKGYYGIQKSTQLT